jgi:DNA-binding response OmpR family regulator
MHAPRVLVIEDDPAVRTLIHALLGRRGYTCDFLADGEEAIRRLRTHDYAAVLLDLMLPGAFGFDVIRFLRAERPAVAARVVVITAACEATLRDFDASSVHALLRKPFDIDELVATVDACASRATSLEHARVARAPVASPM